MKYFFLIYVIIAALVIGIFPARGTRSAKPPLWIFPDMDNQDKLKAQKPSEFFADGAGARQPVEGTFPRGLRADGERTVGGVHIYEFGGGTSYYETGAINDYYSNGMPEELELTKDNATAFLRRGHEMYSVNCTPCHGSSGDGQGMAAQYGVPGVANLTLDSYSRKSYPDGRMFDVISNGKGNMGSYKHNISLRDRWAIVAYVRAMQESRKAPLSDPAVKAAYEAVKKTRDAQ